MTWGSVRQELNPATIARNCLQDVKRAFALTALLDRSPARDGFRVYALDGARGALTISLDLRA
jgi:hypothetical protein